MNRRLVVSASIAAALTVVSCGGSSGGPSTADFSDQLAGVCRTIGRGIGNLDAANSLDDVHSNATDASALFEDGINALKKLTIPSGDKQFAADVKDLIASFEDQLDTLDAIAKSAKESDQAAVDSKIEKLSGQASDSNDLADSLDISRCQLDPVFVAAPPTTEPDVPLTLPIATQPAETIPVETAPPDTSSFDTTPTTVSATVSSGCSAMSSRAGSACAVLPEHRTPRPAGASTSAGRTGPGRTRRRRDSVDSQVGRGNAGQPGRLRQTQRRHRHGAAVCECRRGASRPRRRARQERPAQKPAISYLRVTFSWRMSRCTSAGSRSSGRS